MRHETAPEVTELPTWCHRCGSFDDPEYLRQCFDCRQRVCSSCGAWNEDIEEYRCRDC